MTDELPTKVTSLKLVEQPKPMLHQEGIDRLREMVRQLESGEVTGVAMAFAKADGNMGTWWSNHLKSDFVLYTAVNQLKYRYDQKIDEQDA